MRRGAVADVPDVLRAEIANERRVRHEARAELVGSCDGSAGSHLTTPQGPLDLEGPDRARL